MKNFIKAVIVFLTMFLVVLMCEKVLLLKSEDGIEQMEAFYQQKKDTVDVLFVGSSHIYCDVNTGILWDEYGMASFDLGGAEQPYWNSYYYLEEALKTQTPKVIVLDITTPGIRSVDLQPENWVVCNNYGMQWTTNRIEALKVSTLDQSFSRLLLPLNTIHGRYDELTKEDFIDNNNTINYKGFDPRETVTPFDTPDITNVTEMTPVSEKAEKYLRKIIQLTKERNIPLLMISAPYVVTEESEKLYNYVFQIADENQIPYLDFNKMYKELKFDFQTDMAEELHLNISGNEKFSKYLGNYLHTRYNVPDRRQDENYYSWQTDALIQRQEKAKGLLNQAADLNQYLTGLQNSNFIVYLSFGEGIEQSIFDSQIKNKFAELGVTNDLYMNGQAMILQNGQAIFSTTDDTFKNFIKNEKDRLLYVKEDDGSLSIFVNENRYSAENTGIDIFVYDKVQKKAISHRNYLADSKFTLNTTENME